LKNENDIKIKITAGRTNENENIYNLKNENDIKIKITAGRTNENENYYKRKKRKRKIWGKPYSNIVPTCRCTAMRT